MTAVLVEQWRGCSWQVVEQGSADGRQGAASGRSDAGGSEPSEPRRRESAPPAEGIPPCCQPVRRPAEGDVEPEPEPAADAAPQLLADAGGGSS